MGNSVGCMIVHTNATVVLIFTKKFLGSVLTLDGASLLGICSLRWGQQIKTTQPPSNSAADPIKMESGEEAKVHEW